MTIHCVKLLNGHTFFVELTDTTLRATKAAIINKAEQTLKLAPGTIDPNQTVFSFLGQYLTDDTVWCMEHEESPIYLFPGIQSDVAAEPEDGYELFLSITTPEKTDDFNCLAQPKSLTGFVVSDPHIPLDYALSGAVDYFQKTLTTVTADKTPVLALCLVNRTQLLSAEIAEAPTKLSSARRSRSDASFLKPNTYLPNPTKKDIQAFQNPALLPHRLKFAAQALWYITLPANKNHLIIKDNNPQVRQHPVFQTILQGVKDRLTNYNIVPIFKNCSSLEIRTVSTQLTSLDTTKPKFTQDPLLAQHTQRIQIFLEQINCADDDLLPLAGDTKTLTAHFFVDLEIAQIIQDQLKAEQAISKKINENIDKKKLPIQFSENHTEAHATHQDQLTENTAIPPIDRNDTHRARYSEAQKKAQSEAHKYRELFLTLQESAQKPQASAASATSICDSATQGQNSASSAALQKLLKDLRAILTYAALLKNIPSPDLIDTFISCLNKFTQYKTKEDIVRLYETQKKQSTSADPFWKKGLKFVSDNVHEIEMRSQKTPNAMITKLFQQVKEKSTGDAPQRTLDTLITALENASTLRQ